MFYFFILLSFTYSLNQGYYSFSLIHRLSAFITGFSFFSILLLSYLEEEEYKAVRHASTSSWNTSGQQ